MAKEKDKLEEPEAETPEEAKKPKKKGKLLIIAIIAFAVLAGGAAGAYFLFFSKGAQQGKEAKEVKEEHGVNFALEPFVVNVIDPSGTKYLKVSIQLELSDAKYTEKAKNKTPQLRDAIITLLTNKTSDELITSEGKLLLKDEIKQRCEQILGEGTVKNVFLTDFVMQ
jgi:flagellar FliL protein